MGLPAAGQLNLNVGTPGVRVVTATVDPPLIGAVGAANVDITTIVVETTDRVIGIPPATLEAGLCPQGVTVPSVNVVRVRITNPTAAGIDGAALVWTFLIFEGA